MGHPRRGTKRGAAAHAAPDATEPVLDLLEAHRSVDLADILEEASAVRWVRQPFLFRQHALILPTIWLRCWGLPILQLLPCLWVQLSEVDEHQAKAIHDRQDAQLEDRLSRGGHLHSAVGASPTHRRVVGSRRFAIRIPLCRAPLQRRHHQLEVHTRDDLQGLVEGNPGDKAHQRVKNVTHGHDAWWRISCVGKAERRTPFLLEALRNGPEDR
mmetsp:Transcript_11204/g.23549  ORF Transcript_11204/g.23549 Transcript_11204/m.23549 type:complete len:213 (+) Transcript_11204:1435-2073(+)